MNDMNSSVLYKNLHYFEPGPCILCGPYIILYSIIVQFTSDMMRITTAAGNN